MLFSTKAKNPRTAFRGFFYSVLLWRLNPQAGHRLFITIQPFDDVVADYTSHDSDYKANNVVHLHTSSLYLWEAVTILT